MQPHFNNGNANKYQDDNVFYQQPNSNLLGNQDSSESSYEWDQKDQQNQFIEVNQEMEDQSDTGLIMSQNIQMNQEYDFAIENIRDTQNCFLNVIMQSLYRLTHFKDLAIQFYEYMQQINHFVDNDTMGTLFGKQDNKIQLFLQDFISKVEVQNLAAQNSKKKVNSLTVYSADDMRISLFKIGYAKDQFRLFDQADSCEALEVILETLDKYFQENQNCLISNGKETKGRSQEANAHCMIHHCFHLNLTKIRKCFCKKQEDRIVMKYSDFNPIQLIYANEVINKNFLLNSLQDDSITQCGFKFNGQLSSQLRFQNNIEKTNCSNCLQKDCASQVIIELPFPKILTYNVEWGDKEKDDIGLFLISLPRYINISEIYEVQDQNVQTQLYYIRGMVVFCNNHYICYFKSPKTDEWTLYDDMVIKKKQDFEQQNKEKLQYINNKLKELKSEKDYTSQGLYLFKCPKYKMNVAYEAKFVGSIKSLNLQLQKLKQDQKILTSQIKGSCIAQNGNSSFYNETKQKLSNNNKWNCPQCNSVYDIDMDKSCQKCDFHLERESNLEQFFSPQQNSRPTNIHNHSALNQSNNQSQQDFTFIQKYQTNVPTYLQDKANCLNNTGFQSQNSASSFFGNSKVYNSNLGKRQYGYVDKYKPANIQQPGSQMVSQQQYIGVPNTKSMIQASTATFIQSEAVPQSPVRKPYIFGIRQSTTPNKDITNLDKLVQTPQFSEFKDNPENIQFESIGTIRPNFIDAKADRKFKNEQKLLQQEGTQIKKRLKTDTIQTPYQDPHYSLLLKNHELHQFRGSSYREKLKERLGLVVTDEGVSNVGKPSQVQQTQQQQQQKQNQPPKQQGDEKCTKCSRTKKDCEKGLPGSCIAKQMRNQCNQQ
eukprot:403343672